MIKSLIQQQKESYESLLFTVLFIVTIYPISKVGTDLIPSGYSISTAYPNPFNSSVNIKVVLPLTGDIDIRVFNLAGREIALLAQGQQQAGQSLFTFDAIGQPSGIYLISYHLSENISGVQKVLLVR